MRILIGLTYYRPYVSGLTIYVERLGRALVERGHEVTILTSQFDSSLPREAFVDGVKVVRVPVALRISKGVVMPGLAIPATTLTRGHDVVSLHLPQFDAATMAVCGRLFNKPVILTYHCDLQLPPNPFNRAVNQTVYAANYAAAQLADRIVAYTQDYADHSRLLRRFSRKIEIIPPPVVMSSPTNCDVEAFRAEHGLNGKRVLGYAARFAAEKGVEVLIDGMPELLQRYPDLTIMFAGPYRNVLGEEAYWQRLAPQIEALDDHWKFIGTLSSEQLPAFYASLDSLLVTSVNSTESFGLVQVEAMLCGTPVVASNLPGVRQPVKMTGMGEVVSVADTPALVEGITSVLNNRMRYVRPRSEIEQTFDLSLTVTAYERLFEREMRRKQRDQS